VSRLAIDIGGTHTRIAAAGGQVARFATEPDYRAQLAAVTRAIRSAGIAPSAAGVSFTGRLDPAGRSVTVSLNLPDYAGRPLRDDLAAELSCPVRVAHDATCGLLGEHASGGLRGIDRCGYVTLSTGVGAALRLGRAGHFVVLTTEAGHQLVAGNNRRCACGQHGCLETLTGGRALERHTGRPLAELDDERFWRDYAAALAGILSGRPVYTVYLKVGTPKNWILQYCVPGESMATQTAAGVVSLSNPSPVRAPYPRITEIPKPDKLPVDKNVTFHGFLETDGQLRDLRLVGTDPAGVGPEILTLLSTWLFRPATRDSRPIRVEVVLVATAR
jgi:glucokinase